MVKSFPGWKCLLAALLLGVLAGGWLSGCSAPTSPKQEPAESWDEGLPAQSRNASAPESRPTPSVASSAPTGDLDLPASADGPSTTPAAELTPSAPPEGASAVDSADSAAGGTTPRAVGHVRQFGNRSFRSHRQTGQGAHPTG